MGFDDLSHDGDCLQQCINFDGNLSCKYYAPEELKCLNNPNKYSLLHLNIRSLNKHHSDLVTFLSNSGCSFDVIGCSD